MAKMKASVFIDKAIEIATKYKTLYILGCFGAPMNAKYKARYCNEQNAKRHALIKAATPDTFGFDCVNLIKGILWGWNGSTTKNYGGAEFASNGVPDTNADGMIAKCTDVSTDFSGIVPGAVVWLKGHIGIYIGDGKVVESTPSWQNKVQISTCSNVKSKKLAGTVGLRKWTKWGKLPYVDYTAEAKPAEKPVEKPATSPSAPTAAKVNDGDLVTLAEGATYYSGKAIPARIKGKAWYVKRIVGDRAVLGKSEDGKEDINSPVNAKYLILKKAANAPAEPAKQVKIAGAKNKDKSVTKGIKFAVNTGALNVRSSASAKDKSNVVKVVKRGTKVTWYGYYTGDFYLVQFDDKSTGYVKKDFLRKI